MIAPTRAACETIELALGLELETVLEREHGDEIRTLARKRLGFGIVAGTGTGKTLSIRPVAEEILEAPLKIGVVNREREATPETSTWNVVIVTTGIARRWFQDDLIAAQDTIVADEIHQTSAELELCLALGKRIGCRFIWLSATVDPVFYARYLDSADVLETTAFDPALSAKVSYHPRTPRQFLSDHFVRRVVRQQRGVAVFVPTRAEVEEVAADVGERWIQLDTAFYHGGEPIRVIRPFLEGDVSKPFLLAMTAAGQSALNVPGLDTVVIYDARYTNIVEGATNVLTRQHLGANEILQMAGRVHGRVQSGEVHILTDRDLDFGSLKPTPPEFQLAGDVERVALTAAAIGIDLSDLELPVPLDRRAYRRTMQRLEERGIVEKGRLTAYGRDIEAMPVDRPWGELLVQADEDLIPFVAVSSNIDSLHRMTRDPRNIRPFIVPGSDHLTAYNIFATAVKEFGYVGRVYGLPRHLFADEMEDWAAEHGVLVKAIEDIALGTASVYRSLEVQLPAKLPHAGAAAARRFRDVLAKVAPFSLAIDQQLADGAPVRVSRGSVASPNGAVCGTVRYFADKFGVPRAAIEGSNISLELVRKYAKTGRPGVEFHDGRRHLGLMVTHETEYAGFVLDRERKPMSGEFPADLADRAREALVTALLKDQTPHPSQKAVARSVSRLDEYWRRSGGTLEEADPERVRGLLGAQFSDVRTYEEFLSTAVELDVTEPVPEETRIQLEALPSSAHVLGDRVPLRYELEGELGVVRLNVREGQARRLRERDLPSVDRPLRFGLVRGRKVTVRADSLNDLKRAARSTPKRHKHRRHRTRWR